MCYTLENVLHMEGWAALALAILAPKYLTTDQACDALAKGSISNQSVVSRMFALREKGLEWKEIADLVGLSPDRAAALAATHRKRQRYGSLPKDTAYKVELSAKDMADMIKLRETMTYEDIGNIYGMTDQAVYRRIKRFKQKHFAG
ncbi:MAG: hypothetical protein E6713_06045 [Sporomusaceae bacterium]|nr:hypothetical protein [Sporomusaceae bacterium]